MIDKFLNFLGLCKKSGNVLEGYNKCEAYIEYKKIYLLILSKDVSENTRQKFIKISIEKNIEVLEKYSKEQLGNSIGLKEINVIGITDFNFSKKLLELSKG